MKKLLLILFLPCLLFARQGEWNGGSADMNLITNWTGLSGAIASGDTLTASSGSAAMTASADLTCSKIILTSGYSGAVTLSSRTITTTGGGIALNGTGTFTATTCTIALTGAGDSLLIGAGVGTLTISSLSLSVTATNCFLVTNKSFTIKNVSCVNGSLTATGSALFGLASATTTAVTINNGRLTASGGSGAAYTSTSGSMFSMTAPDTLNGTAAWAIRTSTNIARVTYTGSGAWSFSASASGSYTDSLKGNLDLGTAALTIGKASSGHTIFDANGYVITCGAFQMTNSNATDTAFFLLGTGTLNCASKAVPTSLTGISVLDLGSGTVNCSGNWTNSTNANAIMNVGTSKVVFNGSTASLVTNINYLKQFYDLEINKSGAAACTTNAATDTLYAHELRVTAGRLAAIATVYCNSYLNLSSDTTKRRSDMYINTSFYRASTANASNDTFKTYFITNVNHDISCDTNKTLGRFTVSEGRATALTNLRLIKFNLPVASKLTVTAAKLFRVDSTVDFNGSSGNLDSLVSGTPGSRYNLNIPSDSGAYRYIKDANCTNPMYLKSTAITGGNNLNVKSLSVATVTKDSTTGKVGGHIIFTSAGFVGGGWKIGDTVKTFTIDSYTQATATIPTMPAGTYAVKVWNSDADTVAVGNYEVLPEAPIISYGGPHIDTVGKAASHAVTSTGGTVASYALTSGTLVSTMALNTTTGLISGTPGTTKGVTVYRITATNAGGTGYYDWTESVISGTVPKVALGNLRIVPTSGDTAGGTSILFYADSAMTGSTCGEVDSYTVLTDSTASGTSKVGTVGDFNIVVHSGATDSTVVFRYTAGTNKKRRSGFGFGFGLGTFR